MESNSNILNINSQNMNLELEGHILAHADTIFQISKFPSGKFVSVSKDKTIKIWNEDFTLNQDIKNAHEHSIFNVSIKDDNSFVTCSYDESIIFWNKKNNIFERSEIIYDAHYSQIFKVMYLENGNLISCSEDGFLKIWEEEKINSHQIKTCLNHKCVIYSFLLLDDIHYLITSGLGGTFFWNKNNLKLLFSIKEVKCPWWNSIERIGKDKIVIGQYNNDIMSIINIFEKKVIHEINNEFFINCFLNLEDKGVFLVGGKGEFIKIYRNDNFQLLKTIQSNHNGSVYGFLRLNDKIISFSIDPSFKIWRLT